MSLNGGRVAGHREDGRDARHPSPADAGNRFESSWTAASRSTCRSRTRAEGLRPSSTRPCGRFDYILQGKTEKGGAPTLPGQGHRPVRAPQLTRLLTQHRTTGRGRGSSAAPPRRPFPAPLHEHRHRATRRGRRALRHVVRASHTQALCPAPTLCSTTAGFERLARISNGHLYNLRHSTTYQRRRGATPVSTRPGAGGDRRNGAGRANRFGQPRLRASRFGSSGRLRWPSRACTT